MIIYLDSAVLVATLSNEQMAGRVRDWFDRQSTELAISDWVTTEVSSALSIKLRTGALTLDQRAAALATFRRMAITSLIEIAVPSDCFRVAAGYADRHDLNLRAGDALHLAIAAPHGAMVATLDRRMAQAGPALGIATELLE